MGFLETSVVVYLRELYYPKGFTFPLVIIPNKIAVVEFWREIATIVMLVGAGIIAGKTRLSRFAYFIIAFAIWDTVDQKLLIARDRMGIKPLYYQFKNNVLLFASEIRALIHSGLIDKKINLKSVQIK